MIVWPALSTGWCVWPLIWENDTSSNALSKHVEQNRWRLNASGLLANFVKTQKIVCAAFDQG